MIHNFRSISLLMLTAVLTACGGGGGGGGGGSVDNTNIPITIQPSTAGQAAALVVQTVNVAESPNYNDPVPSPAGVVGISLPVASTISLARAYVNEMKNASASAVVLPVGVQVNQTVACKSGSGTKAYNGGADPVNVRTPGDTLDVTYTNCVLDLTKEGNNCISPTSPLANIKLNGSVRTTVTAVRSATDFDLLLNYTNLTVTNAAGSASDTLNGSLALTQTLTSTANVYTLIATSPSGTSLKSTSSGGVTQTLTSANINVTDTQIPGADCVTPATNLTNNAYTINSATGRIASSSVGYVDFTVNPAASGDSDVDGGFPNSGTIRAQGDGSTFMTMTGVIGGNASVSLNGNTSCTRTWIDLFAGNFAGC